MLDTKANIARQYKLSRARVGVLAEKRFKSAVLPSGLIDTSNEVFQEWVRERTARMETNFADQGANLDVDSIVEVPEEIAPYADLTVREVVERFGTDRRFYEMLKALEKIETVRAKRLQNSEKEGTLVARDLVRKAIIGPIQAAHEALLTDGVRTIATRVMVLIQAGANEKEIEDYLRDYMGSFIRPVKAKMARTAILG